MNGLTNERRLFGVYFALYLLCVAWLYILQDGLSTRLHLVALIKAAFAAIGPAFLVVLAISRYLWRFRLVRGLLGIQIPYIGGRWEGFIRSSFTDHAQEHPVAVEFWQTLGHLTVWYYDANAITSSLIAGFLRENHGGPLRIYAIYRNQPIKTNQRTLQTHSGVMELTIMPNSRRIMGTYYNNPHQRSTYGEIELAWKQRRRLGTFIAGK